MPQHADASPVGTPAARTQLRTALLQRHPWLADTQVGPAAVEAGECDRCGVEPRVVTVCGPGSAIHLGRRCAVQLGTHAWCGGHEQQAEEALAAIGALPGEADAAARLWWVATGEVRVDPELLASWRRTALALDA